MIIRNPYCYFIVSIIIFVSCTQTNNPIDENVNNDGELFAKVSNYVFQDSIHSLQYRSDSTFTEYYHEIGSWPLPNPVAFDIQYERTGKYKIEDGMLIYYNVHVELDTSKFLKGPDVYQDVYIELLNQKVEIVNNKVVFSPVYIFDNIQKNKNIIGSWATINWMCDYHNVPYQKRFLTQGRVKTYYNISDNENVIKFGYIYIDGQPFSTSEFTVKYEYDPPVISFLSADDRKYKISLNSSKMYWFPISSTQYNSFLSPTAPNQVNVGKQFSVWYNKAGNLFRIDIQNK